MRYRPKQDNAPGRCRRRTALPPGRLPVCGRNAECRTPRVSCSGERSRSPGRSANLGRSCTAKALSAERAGDERSEPPPLLAADAARQGRGRSGDEHTPTPDPPQAGRWRRCNQRTKLLTKRRSEPFTRQKGRRSLHPQIGAPRKKSRGAGGEKNAERFAFPCSALLKNICRALVKTGKKGSPNNTEKALAIFDP